MHLVNNKLNDILSWVKLFNSVVLDEINHMWSGAMATYKND